MFDTFKTCVFSRGHLAAANAFEIRIRPLKVLNPKPAITLKVPYSIPATTVDVPAPTDTVCLPTLITNLCCTLVIHCPILYCFDY